MYLIEPYFIEDDLRFGEGRTYEPKDERLPSGVFILVWDSGNLCLQLFYSTLIVSNGWNHLPELNFCLYSGDQVYSFLSLEDQVFSSRKSRS